MGRTGNRQSSIYLGKDGHWHGRVTVGRKDDGSLDRRHVMSKSKATVVAKVRAPRRRQTNGIIGATKSAAGNRVVGLPEELVALLKDHRRQQLEERIRAGSLWEEGSWMFTTLVGRPIAPNSDYHEWRALLESVGVRHARLHDARHTAATVLLVLGVPERTVMSIMGWSSTSMAARYQHVTDPIRREVASRVGGLLFGDSRQSDSTALP